MAILLVFVVISFFQIDHYVSMYVRHESVNMAPWKPVSPINSGRETPKTWQQDQDQSKTQAEDLRMQ